MNVFCCQCDKYVDGRVTDGGEIYPHREDLGHLQFVICDVCKNYKSIRDDERETFIPTEEVRRMRRAIHAVLDPLWQKKKIRRKKAYSYLSHRMGYTYHNGELRDIKEALKAYDIVRQLEKEIKLGNEGIRE